VGLPIRLNTQQPTMLRIEIKEKIVADLKNLRPFGAIGREPQHLVGAVAVVINKMPDDSRGARLAIRLKRQTGKQIRGNRYLKVAQLTPGDDPVIVAVEPDSIVEVTQRDVPLPNYFLPIQPEAEVAVARLVRRRRRE
jgi:hypothetical protein